MNRLIRFALSSNSSRRFIQQHIRFASTTAQSASTSLTSSNQNIPSVRKKADETEIVESTNDPQVMPIIERDQLQFLSESEQLYIKRFEERHEKNLIIRKDERRRARIIGIFFAALVVGIYAFTMLRVKRETFLDDFQVPEPPPQKQAIVLD
ncbi:unnamed protein product [Didymodactylos carnosus]|uniref:Cytochrome c oxidase assembly factor 3 mitochondrial coiled-coil domain-containing protein n=1 Tax=Didymodactylos carnosus TaxID=1234261 RepID=A0A814R2B8_9BILA|nr:unnamed protein product [Didymodactylos carnosus]CAF1585121.1 unnamed protein product [Didymodactylos carnosus]CAF3890810.1 unnamed protein product [Didymodactylos carnosus]CAF4386112.1 unnamed protein product [Didymodactylos carnosus]